MHLAVASMHRHALTGRQLNVADKRSQGGNVEGPSELLMAGERPEVGKPVVA